MYPFSAFKFIIGRHAPPGLGTTKIGLVNPVLKSEVAGQIASFSDSRSTSNVKALVFSTSKNGWLICTAGGESVNSSLRPCTVWRIQESWVILSQLYLK